MTILVTKNNRSESALLEIETHTDTQDGAQANTLTGRAFILGKWSEKTWSKS